MELVKFENVFKQYGDVIAVKGVNFEVTQGSIHGVIGLSGSGKTTLVKLLTHIENITSGAIYFEGRNIFEYSPKELQYYRRSVGMIFQHFNLLTSRTVAGNVAFALEICNYPKEKMNERIDYLLDLVGLSSKRDVYPPFLSGGQKQRVAIARALANNPKMLLSDEATSALDPKTTRSILDLIKDLQKRLSLTVILITHQMEVVKSVCTDVTIMQEGAIVEFGKTSEVFASPKTQYTKDLINHKYDEDPVAELVQ